jgi:serine/threonine protein kinase
MEAAELANLRIQQSYTKERKIGEGTYASVYEGHQKKSGRKVAIKKIKVGSSFSPYPRFCSSHIDYNDTCFVSLHLIRKLIEIISLDRPGWSIQRWVGHVSY